MKIHHAVLARSENDRPLVLAIGFFDGVHRGHQAILRELRQHRRPGYCAAALTFENHPATYLRPGSRPALITTLEERVNLLAANGIEELYLLPFDERIANIEAQQFLDEILLERLRIRTLVFGENFRFGARRVGDARFAREVLEAHGVKVVAIAPLREGDDRVSSTGVRTAITRGDLTTANALMGHSYALRGRVVLGEGRGHDLGFPTANLAIAGEKLLPPDGVYAIVGRYDGRDYRGLVSIGSNPTFDGATRTIEAWLLDFERTVYGEEIVLRDFRFVREQRTFDTVEELRIQMREDATHAPFPSLRQV